MKKNIIFLSLVVVLTDCKTLIPLNKLPSKVLTEVIKEENLGKVQFYIDRQVALHLDSAEMNVDFDKKGAILQKNNHVSEDVIIRKRTKGVYALTQKGEVQNREALDQPVHNDLPSRPEAYRLSIPVSFDDEGSLMFVSSDGKLPFLLAVNGKFIIYSQNGMTIRYRLLEGGSAQLLVSKKILNSLSKNKKVAPGKKVEN